MILGRNMDDKIRTRLRELEKRAIQAYQLARFIFFAKFLSYCNNIVIFSSKSGKFNFDYERILNAKYSLASTVQMRYIL